MTQQQHDQWQRERLLEALDAHRRGIGDAPVLRKWSAYPGDAVGPDDGQKPDEPMAFVISTDEVDRHGDVIAADGWNLEAYRKNPVFLWAHDYARPVIGKAVDIWKEPHRLMAKIQFAPTEFAQEVAGLHETGYQRGVSVGFKPIRYEERRDEKTGAFLGIRFLEQEVLEVSAVPVPANRNALRRSGQPDLSALPALWPVLESQVDELAKLAGEIADTVAELENTAKGAPTPGQAADLAPDIISVLRSGRI